MLDMVQGYEYDVEDGWDQENVGGNENGTAISYATRISESIC